jgi:hypothetical protein|nr:MAG TPA: hypothetical protein [Caudoviricetes sp.]
MNEDIERLKLTIYRLIGENNGLRFVVGLRRRTMNCVAVNCNSKEKNSGCIILDIRTGKKVV